MCHDRERFCLITAHRHTAPNITYSSSGEENRGTKCAIGKGHIGHHLAAAVRSELLRLQQRGPDTHQDSNKFIKFAVVNDFLDISSMNALTPLTLRIPSAREACCLSLT